MHVLLSPGMGAIGPHAEAQKMARFALELLDDVNKIRTDALGAAQISVRIAIHTGRWDAVGPCSKTPQ